MLVIERLLLKAKSLEEELFRIDRMRTTVSDPSQATVHLADKKPQDLYYECLDEGEAWQFPTPKLLYKIDMQARMMWLGQKFWSIHFQCQFPKKHVHNIAILMRILMVHLHHPRGQMQLR